MKKLVLIVMALVLVLSTSVVFADEMPTVKISKMFFSADEVPAYGTAPSKTGEYTDYASMAWAAPNGELPGDVVTAENGVLTYQGGKTYINFNIPNGTHEGVVWADIRSFKYMAFLVDNISTQDVQIVIIPAGTCAGGQVGGALTVENALFYNEDGTQATDASIVVHDNPGYGQDRGYVNIPAGKAVWVVLPMTAQNVPNFAADQNGTFSLPANIAQSWVDNGITANTALHLTGLTMAMTWVPQEAPSESIAPENTEPTESTAPENTESTEPENTESTEPENTESTEPENTESEQPTEEISEQPSEETTDDAGDNGDDSTDTADLSVIAYAAAAITGLGALVVAKRK